MFVMGADEDGNVRPPSVEMKIDVGRDDEPTVDFDVSDSDPEKTRP
jgi:hypothetical protein